MFTNNLSYELKLLFRGKWLLLLVIIIVSLVTFATYNGQQNVAKRQADIQKMKEQLKEKDSKMLTILADIEGGKKVDIPYWKLPSEPMTIGYRYPRLATMPPAPLSFLATGQSDMYTHFKSPTVYGNNFALDYAEMVNPVQLLFGSFDVAFVIIYILPLLIIAFTFNVLSKEKELGTLELLMAQPISLLTWLVQKLIIRYVLFTIITIGVLLINIALFSITGFNDSTNIMGLLLIIAIYILFWFMVACVVNIKINNSSKNALVLIGVWLLVVLIIPATVNQVGNTLYPTPSRLKMINEIRQIKKENEEKQDEILNNYLRNHPELAQDNNKEKFNFWHNYFASEKVLEEKTKPLVAAYDVQLKKQQKLIGVCKYISPAILMQESLNNIAGTSENHYNDFKKQVFQFSDEWRNYLVPMLFKEQKFTTKNYHELPVFKYQNSIKTKVWMNILVITLISLLLLFLIPKKLVK